MNILDLGEALKASLGVVCQQKETCSPELIKKIQDGLIELPHHFANPH